ncbi:DNA repair protein RecN [bacterium]|nr:DNA repair protein RecN [bacterium]
MCKLISYINIKNIALIQELSLELQPGLNILSGETGAGKSIIIDSINFVLGDRADRSLIRYGESTARVEVVFTDIANFDGVKALLQDAGIECDDETVIVNRYMTQDKSECRINGRIVNLFTLRNLVALLVDIHSQNEHQSLLKILNHITLLDAYNSKIGNILEVYRTIFADYKQVLSKIDNFLSTEERVRRLDLLQYQIEEIERVAWKENEEEILNNERSRYYNAQKIATALNAALENLEGSVGFGGIASIRRAYSELNSILKYDESVAPFIERLDASLIELDDISASLNEKIYGNDIESIDIESVEKRINDINSLKRKYGKTVEEVNTYYSKIKEENDILLYAEENVAKLVTKKTELEGKLIDLVEKLHNERCFSAVKFEQEIQNNLVELGMKNSVFQVKIELSEDILASLNLSGADYVEFMLSPNLGEPLKPLAKIASGGEMSRFMLALKNVIAELDNIDTLIFDEIDTGISGVIAKVVACKLFDIAKTRQVIAITHLPQLASMADINFLIEKEVISDKTLTFVKKLDSNDTFKEIMRLSGFTADSKVGLDGAKEMKKWADNYKISNNF